MPDIEVGNAGKKEHLYGMLKTFDAAMLVTRAPDGHLHGRPLRLATEQIGEDGKLYFATSVTTPKVGELDADSRVAITMQDSRRYVSVSGQARTTRDRTLSDRLWSDAWKIWFPKGKEDPALCIITVTPEVAEYWDGSGVPGIKFLFEMVRAFTTDTKAQKTDEDQNAKVDLRTGRAS
jgi:general stress protein 26